MDRTRWIIFGLVVLAALIWLVLSGNKNSTDVSKVNAFTVQRDGAIADNVYGNPDAKVVLYEYGDFQCPACRSAYPTVTAVKEKYKDQIAFVFRHYPLTNIHPNALAASTTAEAAAEQGKFWEMHNMLYDNQDSWGGLSAESRTQAFEGYASQLGLDVDKFRADLQNPAVAEKIRFDRALGKKLGVDSTPTFYLNDQKLETSDWNQAGALDAKIAEALKRAGVELPAAAAAPEPSITPAEEAPAAEAPATE